MNDFLQSIRNGSFSKDNGNSSKPRYNNQRTRRPYESNGNYTRNNGNERKYRPKQNDNGQMDETMVALKETLTAILANQEAGKGVAERRAIAEERKADAFEFIAHHIGDLVGSKFVAEDRAEVSVEEISVEELSPEPLNEGDVEFVKASQAVLQDDVSSDNSSDMNKDDILGLIITMRNDGSTYNEIASHLDVLNLPTFSGRGKWHAQTIHRLCQTA